MYGSGLSDASPPSFVDFRPFSGYTTPLVKQYAQNVGLCGGVVAALNVYSLNYKNTAASVARMEQFGKNVTVGLLAWN